VARQHPFRSRGSVPLGLLLEMALAALESRDKQKAEDRIE
jgi:hypothetical protein